MAENLVLTRDHLRKLSVFKDWPDEKLDPMITAMDFTGSFQTDEVCLNEGLPSEHILLLLYGELGTRSKGVELGNVQPGEFCLEGALDMSGTAVRNAEVYTRKDSGIVCYRPNEFREALDIIGGMHRHQVYTHLILTPNRRLGRLNQRVVEGTTYELDKGDMSD